MYPMPHPRTICMTMSIPKVSVPHCNDTLVIIHDPMLICHYHPKSIVYFKLHPWYCIFYGFNKYAMISVYRNTIQNSFTALKILCSLPIHLTLLPTPGNH